MGEQLNPREVSASREFQVLSGFLKDEEQKQIASGKYGDVYVFKFGERIIVQALGSEFELDFEVSENQVTASQFNRGKSGGEVKPMTVSLDDILKELK